MKTKTVKMTWVIVLAMMAYAAICTEVRTARADDTPTTPTTLTGNKRK